MKKIILTASIMLGATIVGYSQFSDQGYKNLKLGMTVKEAQAIHKFTLEDDQATITVDGVKLELSFTELEELVLWVIRSTDSKAKVVGSNATLIGKSRNEIISLFGDKVRAMELDGPTEDYYIYTPTAESRDNDMTSCVFRFNDDGIVEEVFAAYNP